MQQNAYHDFDTYVPFKKQIKMMEIILYLYEKSKNLVDIGIPIRILVDSGIYEKIISIKYDIGNDDLKELDNYFVYIDDFYNKYKKA